MLDPFEIAKAARAFPGRIIPVGAAIAAPFKRQWRYQNLASIKPAKKRNRASSARHSSPYLPMIQSVQDRIVIRPAHFQPPPPHPISAPEARRARQARLNRSTSAILAAIRGR